MNRFKRLPDLEFESPDRMRAVQEQRLRAHVAYCSRRSPFYRRLLRKSGRLAAVTLDRLQDLPITDKDDFVRHNEEFLAVPAERIVDIVLSSGTTGSPARVMYTEADLQRLAYNEEISFRSCGVTRDDVVLLTCTMDRCFVAGLAYFLGIRALGAAAIRNGHGTMAGHLAVIQTMRPTVIVGVPTFLRKLGQYLRDSGLAPADAAVRTLVCIGEPVRDRNLEALKLGRDLQTLWNATVHSTYASSECITTFCECTAQQGGHLHPDLAVVEILDDRGRPVPEGATGEVVLTPLALEGMPLIRFRTGDESFLIPEPCACGRRSPRLGPIVGRKQQMMKVRGTTLYPQAVYAALDEIPEVGEYYLEVTSDADLSDCLTIHLAAQAGLNLARVQDILQARLRVKPGVVVDPEAEVRHHVYSPEFRKPVRFVDRRTV